jgi:LysR family transcriptional regulator, regulator of abg operon
MKLHHLRAFLALAEGGSLVKAAASLNRTTAAVSKAIRELEDDFQIPLFIRTPYGMSLAEGGRVLLPRAQAMLAERMRADEELRSLRGLTERRLRIGVSPAVAVLIAPPVIERFLVQYPDVQLEVYENQREQMAHRLDDGTLDLVLYGMPSYMEDAVDDPGTLICTMGFTLAVRCGSPFERATTLGELSDALWIYTDPRGIQQDFIARAYRSEGLAPPARTLLCNSQLVAFALTQRLDAIGFAATAIVESNRQVPLPLLPGAPALRVYSMVRPSAPASPVVEAFLDMTRQLT